MFNAFYASTGIAQHCKLTPYTASDKTSALRKFYQLQMRERIQYKLCLLKHKMSVGKQLLNTSQIC